MANIFVFSRDPGATQQLIAMLDVLSALRAADEKPGLAALRAAMPADPKVLVYARPPGETTWRGTGFSPQPWNGYDDEVARKLLASAARTASIRFIF